MYAKYYKSLNFATALSGGRNLKTRDLFANVITAKLLVIPQISAVSHPHVLNVTSNMLQKTAQNPQDHHRHVLIVGALIQQIFLAAHSISNRYNISNKIPVDHTTSLNTGRETSSHAIQLSTNSIPCSQDSYASALTTVNLGPGNISGHPTDNSATP